MKPPRQAPLPFNNLVPFARRRSDEPSSMRCRQLSRTLAILRALQGARLGLSLAMLAREHGTCERTIRRDIEALEAAGFPLMDVMDANTGERRWRLVPSALSCGPQRVAR
jgi:hypothetical protein